MLKRLLLTISGTLFLAGSLSAQVIPDAGSISRDQAPQKPLPEAQPKLGGGKESESGRESDVRVVVKGFSFSGYEGLASEAELQTLVSGSIGKTIGFVELNALTEQISAYCKKKGLYQARAYLPAQDITGGMIQIALLQVRSEGRMIFKRDKTVRVRECILEGIGKSGVREGQAINEQRLERSLLLMDDLPGVTVKATVVPGVKEGYSVVETNVTEGSLISGMVWVDNYGNRYTGVWRGNAMVALNDPLRRGDQLTVLYTGASGMDQGRIGYSIPLTCDGLLVNVGYTAMKYELGGDLSALSYKGKSHSVDAGLSYPIMRSRTNNLTGSVSYGYRHFTDSQGNIDLSKKSMNGVVIMLRGDEIDQVLGGGALYYMAGMSMGKVHQSIGAGGLTSTDGSYTHFNVNLIRLQRVGDRVNVKISGSAQMALNNLDSSEKTSLGGPNGVRAYPLGEAAGDDGQLINADLLYTLPLPTTWGSFQLDAFYDAGHITLNHNRFPGDVVSATGRNDYWLHGVGLGLNYNLSPRGALRASWAYALGDNPGRSLAGNNADGRNTRSQFWVQGMIYF